MDIKHEVARSLLSIEDLLLDIVVARSGHLLSSFLMICDRSGFIVRDFGRFVQSGREISADLTRGESLTSQSKKGIFVVFSRPFGRLVFREACLS